ncbi:MAG: helix-turn-helix domain-containing protein [Phototrophicaceae bacterium]
MVNKIAPPTPEETQIARQAKQILGQHLVTHQSLKLRLMNVDDEATIEMPSGAVTLLMDILDAMSRGQNITLISENSDLTTVQAADILRVSRPYLIKLLENGDIPHYMVGTHRRILLEDVLQYKQAIDQEREHILDDLVADAQDQNMGY